MTAAALVDNPRRVIVAMDGSDHSEYAFNWYLENVHRTGNRVIVVFCPEYKGLIHSSIMSNDKELVSRMVTEEEKNAKLYLAKMQEMVKRSEVDGTLMLLNGDPGEAIVKAASENDADFIVTGTRGLGKLKRALMGSVSMYIRKNSHVPVIVCRETAYVRSRKYNDREESVFEEGVVIVDEFPKSMKKSTTLSKSSSSLF